jgi:RNA polymerase sigma factor (sigma-70 family)
MAQECRAALHRMAYLDGTRLGRLVSELSAADIAPEEPWLAALKAGNSEAAWNCFIDEYRRLIFATIRHYTRDHDEVMDAFAEVCGALRHDDLARLRKYWDRPTHTARFPTWLVTVVRHRVIDWMRQRALRSRPRFHGSFSRLQQQIFEFVFIQHRSHVETYELLCATSEPALSFGAFLRELRATYRAVDASGRFAREIAAPVPLSEGETLFDAASEEVADPAVIVDTRLRIKNALSSLEPDDRLAVEMFVVYGMPAAAVARVLQWPNPKAVYNRVYRGLARLRASLMRQGIRREDL